MNSRYDVAVLAAVALFFLIGGYIAGQPVGYANGYNYGYKVGRDTLVADTPAYKKGYYAGYEAAILGQ